MNGSIPPASESVAELSEPAQRIQVTSDQEIARRLDPAVRLPRQVEHYGRLVDHYLNVKNSAELRVSLEAHFARLSRYHQRFLKQGGPAPVGSDDANDK